MTKAAQRHLSRVASLGCALCRHLGYGDSPAELHHPRTGTGAGRRAPYSDVIPLCPNHHRLGNYAFHTMGRKAFERYYQITETDLLAMTIEALA